MSKTELLNRCKKGGTQNVNESFHQLIWISARKVGFVGLRTLKIAVGQAVCQFNAGRLAGLGTCLEAVTGGSLGPRSRASFAHYDANRIKASKKDADELEIRRRQHRALEKTRQQNALVAQEGGTSYCPGFGDSSSEDEEDEEEIT